MSAKEIGKSRFDLAVDGKGRWSVQWLLDSQSEIKTGIPKTYDSFGLKSSTALPWNGAAGKWLANAQYEGLADEPTADDDSYDLTGELRDVKIESIGLTDILKEEYGATEEDGRLKFAAKITPPSIVGSFAGLPSEKLIDNPFFNLTTVPVEYEVARWTLLRKKKPSAIIKLKGTVVSRLPAGFEYSGNAESWYVRPITQSKRGSRGYWSITVEFQQVDEFRAQQALIDIAKKGGAGGSLTGTYGSAFTGLG